MINVFAVKMGDRMDRPFFEALMSYVPKEKQNRINRFRRYQDAQSTLIGEVLVRKLIYENTGIDNHCIVLGKNDYGKPFLKGRDGIHFNISHSGEWVACATHNKPVGVDIEQVKSSEFDLAIAKRFFSKDEYDQLMAMGEEDRISYFYELWTLKESYIKAEGKGLSIPLNSFSFATIDGKVMLAFSAFSKGYYFKQYALEEQYKMAVCGGKDEFAQSIQTIALEDLLF